MKYLLFLIPTLLVSTVITKSQDTIKLSFSFNYSIDLSDSFSGGSILSGDFIMFKSWYGAGINYGYFQSHSTVKYQILIEEEDKTFDIPFDELAIMRIGSVFGILTPIKKDRFKFDIVFGIAYGKSKNLCFRSLSYTYDTNDKVLTSVEKDYYFIEDAHFGYLAGTNISFNVFKKIGIQVTSRLQDLSNGGTFFFVGGGLVLNL